MLDIDLSKTEKSQAPSKGPIPEGRYQVSITDAEVKTTKAGTGQYIKAEFTIKEGEYSGKKIWSMFNIKNQNPKAVEIGLQQLKDMLVAANSNLANGKLESVSQLRGLRMTANVKIESSEEYGDQNRINYFDYSESQINQGAPNMAPQFSSDEELPF